MVALMTLPIMTVTVVGREYILGLSKVFIQLMGNYPLP
ncbi:hypothetical protein Xoosp13_147 [Xanthomonas phage Xoo-sp13]|nr:hypothetical protein Xoosp13_147 [Xanthomonas phage Xoo-sp13]